MAMETQLQIRQNAMEVQEYMSELFEWEKSMKKGPKKAAVTKADTGSQGSVPGPRGRAASSIAPAPKELQAPALTHTSAPATASKPKKAAANGAAPVATSAAAHTYSSYSKWDKLNVDAMLASDDEDEEQPASQPIRPAGPSTTTTSTTLQPARTSTPLSSSPKPGIQILPDRSEADLVAHATTRRTPQPEPSPTPSTHPGDPTPSASHPAPLPPVRNSEPQTADAWRMRGNDLFKAGQWAFAKDCYSRCLTLDATSAPAWANRAMAELKLSQWVEAEEDCTQAINLDPSYVKAFHRRGTARKALGKLVEAAQDFEDAFRLEPTNKSLLADRDATLAAHMTAVKLPAMSHKHRVPVTPSGPPTASQQPSLPASAAAVRKVTVPEPSRDTAPLSSPAARPAVLDAQLPRQHRDISSGGVDQAGSSSSAHASPRSPSQHATPAVKGKLAAAASAAAQQLSSRLASQVKPPKTSTEFESTWRALGSDLASQLSYLRAIQPTQLPHIFKSSLTPQHLVSILSVLLQGVGQSAGGSGQGWGAQDALAFMQGLTQVPRVSMAAMCVGSKQKAELQALWEDALGPDRLPASVSAGDCLHIKQLLKL